MCPSAPIAITEAVVAAIGLSSLMGLILVKQRSLSCGSDVELVRANNSRFFTGIAFAEVPALAGFVATILVDSTMPYFIGAGMAACGFALVAPTRSELRRTQELLRSDGCNRSLGAIMAKPLGGAPM